MIKDHLIIFFPLVDWDAPWQRYQHLAMRFSRNNRVIYLNFSVALTYFFRNPKILLKKWVQFFNGRREITSNLTVCSSPPCFPFERRYRWINKLNQYFVFLYIKIFVRPKGSLILWINDPYKYDLIKLLKPKMAVYDCPDAIVFEGDTKRQELYDELRKKILRKSTVCFFTSRKLIEEGKRYSQNCFYVPNGVDIQSFVRKRNRAPEEIRKLPGIILGVVGTFDERVDIDLINYILDRIQNATLVLVGPVGIKMGKLTGHRRVVLVGKRSYQEIPSFIGCFDVALIPYRINSVTMAVYPVKLHEYLLMGKPVVSTNLPEVRQFSDVVLIADSKREFVSQILKALEDNDESKRRKRIEVARNNSWEKRINEISKYIQRYLN